MRFIPRDDRPREKLVKHGARILTQSELLALLLTSGLKDKNVLEISRDILNDYDLEKLARMNVSELQKIRGIGKAKACQLAACFELGRRIQSFNGGEALRIDTAEKVFRIFGPKLEILQSEHFICLYVNARKRLLKEKTLFKGTLNESLVYPREIFKVAFEEGAAGIILIHNHPSGNAHPSKEDLDITEELVDAGRLLGVNVLDHVIIGKGTYFSMKENGVM